MSEAYDDFMSGILEQLYKNREKYEDNERKDESYFFKVSSKQFGQLGAALAGEDWERASLECFHLCAVVFEVWERANKKLKK